MGNFYLNIETTGINPCENKILTIQFQELDRNTGEPIGELKIFKEWGSSEKEIISQFLSQTKITDSYAFTFIPVGYNLAFVLNFLKQRTALYEISFPDMLDKPLIDLRAIGVLMNSGEFRGSGLDNLLGREKKAHSLPVWYNNSEFEKILEYIKEQTTDFLKFATWAYKKFPALLDEFKSSN